MKKRLIARCLIVLFSAVCFVSCEKMKQYHPNEVRLDEADKNLNAKNISVLAAQPIRDSFRFIVVGDSQRFYDELQLFVSAVNNIPNISFVILNGDISDFGLNREFKWISRELKRLKAPFIGVIGNHDMLANGRLIYSQMFGTENFSFRYSGYKFICINSNSREVGFDGTIPDISWLQSELNLGPATEKAFVFAHVSPFSADFDPQLSGAYDSTLAASNKVRYSVHGHDHNFSLSQPYGPPVHYVIAPSVNKRSFALVNVRTDTTIIEQVLY